MYLVIAFIFDYLATVCEELSMWAWRKSEGIAVAPPPKRTPPTWRQGSEQ